MDLLVWPAHQLSNANWVSAFVFFSTTSDTSAGDRVLMCSDIELKVIFKETYLKLGVWRQ